MDIGHYSQAPTAHARPRTTSGAGDGGVKNSASPTVIIPPNILQGCSGGSVAGRRDFLAGATDGSVLVPDLFLYATELRRIFEFADPITQATAFALGRSYGLRVKTLAGMANCSQSTVGRRLRLFRAPRQDQMAA